ncbi:MAG TPA: DUF374 domain-containing protein [Planctomycetota bacterium]|nr:DUF374 domain-containing protein [Planctomycetota bacterium]
MSLGKRFLRSSLALALTGLLVRSYRALAYATFLWKFDPRLVRLLRSREPAVFVCWHQDFVHTMGYVSRFSPRRPTYVLASASRDGGLAAAAAEAVGFREAVRGSSAARGASALLRMTRIGRGERRPSLAVVADGPRPPARVLKPGALHLARETGAPLWLLRSAWSSDVSLSRTWAKFHLPRPWSKGLIVAEGPIVVAPDLDRAGLEALRADLEARMVRLAARADALAASAWGRGRRHRKKQGPGEA